MVEGVWAIGVEREVTPGNYALLAAEVEGWALWRFETRSGVYFTAAKAARGARRPEPMGVGQAVYGGAPSIHVHLDGEPWCTVQASLPEKFKAEMRVIGDRFMQTIPPRFDPMPYDGKQLEILVKSSATARASSQAVEDHGIIDMTGLAAVIEARAGMT